MKKFYVQNNNNETKTFVLQEDELYHFATVLRGKIGDKILVLCGDDFIYECEVVSLTKKEAVAKIINKKVCEANPQKHISVFQGLPKSDKLEFITQKLTELGITEIIPFESNFTIAKHSNIKTNRINKIAIEACKQCGRSKPLIIQNTIKLKNIAEHLNTFNLVIFLNEKENPENTLKTIQSEISSANKIAIVVGAEGGFSDEETQILTKLPNVKSISLGKRILRTETASIALASFVSLLNNN